jgi:hypothetical protein
MPAIGVWLFLPCSLVAAMALTLLWVFVIGGITTRHIKCLKKIKNALILSKNNKLFQIGRAYLIFIKKYDIIYMKSDKNNILEVAYE